jgi:hypothetical protein
VVTWALLGTTSTTFVLVAPLAILCFRCACIPCAPDIPGATIKQEGAFQAHEEMRLTGEQHWPLALIVKMLVHRRSVTSQAWLNASATEANPSGATMAA